MRRWLALSCILAVGLAASADERQADARALAPLFASNSTLDIELETDLPALTSSRRQPGFQPGVLRWRGDGGSGELTVGVSPRGRFRLDRENCRFPPLFIRFADDADGLFAGQRTVPVTTHCAPASEDYVVEEYLLYRAYGLLTESSVTARLARTRYIDASGRRRPLDTLSFLLEHFDDVAARTGASVVGELELRPGETEPQATALVDVFQFFIGNTDWSILAQHNIALLRSAAGDLVPLPYDFDFAGVINARYATPSDKLPIHSVTERIYRGFCQPAGVVEGAIARLTQGKPAIYALYRETPELAPKRAARSLRYYDTFFEIAQSPETLRRHILEACRKAPAPSP